MAITIKNYYHKDFYKASIFFKPTLAVLTGGDAMARLEFCPKILAVRGFIVIIWTKRLLLFSHGFVILEFAVYLNQQFRRV
ncbi:hypothetical protein [Dolichospermum sp. UHCC 0259]|uniref:hypothetical protein n=1 Tax=Dolichospermum sp. UHCC 0259 TaxID=2590010 RepID=UPI0014467C00|nr:hypothetical protein [Dolichospermum sp. UHCC 0259]MTJ50256.1 hypothetical protein [Dolichospermum sp. UHCC 0259]